MHMVGSPTDMQANPTYDEVVNEVCEFLRQRVAYACERGVSMCNTIIDPGIGFGKTPQHNLEIMRRLRELKSLGRPILVGTSRKSTIGRVLGRPVHDRVWGTAATVRWRSHPAPTGCECMTLLKWRWLPEWRTR